MAPSENPFGNASVKKKEAQAEQLFATLAGIQLQYCIELYNGKLPFPPEQETARPEYNKNEGIKAFSEVLLKYSTLEKDIYMSYCNSRLLLPGLKQGDIQVKRRKDPDFARYEADILKEIFTAYTHISVKDRQTFNLWLHHVGDIMAQRDRVYENKPPEVRKQFEKRMQQYLEENKPESVGIIQYEIIRMVYPPKELSRRGIPEGALAVRIHLAPLFLKSSREKGWTDSATKAMHISCMKLIRRLSSIRPPVNVILADSWLLDMPVARELGFHSFDAIQKTTQENFFSGEGFWGQFIDKTGQIRQERVRKLFQQGAPTYNVKSGYVLVSELKNNLMRQRLQEK